jgi:hypothetical protein
VARAKQTNRSEARRRYRQAQPNTLANDAMAEPADDAAPAATTSPARQAARPAPARQAASGTQRVGFLGAFRGAYHPARPLEDLKALPPLLIHWSFFAAMGLVLFGAVVAFIFPNYTGSAFAWELLVLPGSALAPQLVAGFFAKRASYILGLLVGLFQGIVFSVFVTQFSSRLGTPFPADKMGSLLTLSFLTGPISGALFAAAAAWYRRFLQLSSPRRIQDAGRAGSKAAPAKRSNARR